jgi:hypothetical protein
VKYLVVVAISGGERSDICVETLNCETKKGRYMWLRDPKTRCFFGDCLVNAMYNSAENKRNQKEIHVNVNPKNVNSPRGRRLRFQLINSKFPAPLKIYLFPCGWQNKPHIADN